MKKNCYVILGLFVASTFSCASITAKKTVKESSVWEISDGENTVYLAGSVHILPKGTEIPSAFKKAFALSNAVVFEADVSQLESDPKTRLSLRTKMILPKGQTLKTTLKNDSYQKLSDACKLLGLSVEQFERIKPSVVLNTLGTLQLQQFGFTEKGVDFYYEDRAKKAHKKMMFLETNNFQINLLMTMFDDKIDEYISYALEDLKKDKSETEDDLARMLSDWTNGTNEYVIESNNEMNADYPSVYVRLLKDRNNNWVPIIKGYFKTKPVEFVIVGLAHIHGEDGLLKQLEAAGYRISKLR
ncbi:MAG: hypothetical protein Ta2B_12770 [Termitinemataceae bacterium]|nr:MAG: hypothetical protein Ta2B_12770 [Termitinemataceae bacterium]